MATIHKFVDDGAEAYLPFLLAREREIRRRKKKERERGRGQAVVTLVEDEPMEGSYTANFDFGDNIEGELRMVGNQSFIRLTKNGSAAPKSTPEYVIRPSDDGNLLADPWAMVQAGSIDVGLVGSTIAVSSKPPMPVGNVDWMSTDGKYHLSWDAPGWNRYPLGMLYDNEGTKSVNSFYSTSDYIYHKGKKVTLRGSTGENIGVLGVAITTLNGTPHLVCAGRYASGQAGTTQFFVKPFKPIEDGVSVLYMTPIGSVTGSYTPYPFYFSSDGTKCCSLATNGYSFWGGQATLLTTVFSSASGTISVATTYNESDNLVTWDASDTPMPPVPDPDPPVVVSETRYHPIFPEEVVYSATTSTWNSSYSGTGGTSEHSKVPVGVDFLHGSSDPVIVFVESDRVKQTSQFSTSFKVQTSYYSAGSPHGPEPAGNDTYGSTSTDSSLTVTKEVSGRILFGSNEMASAKVTEVNTKNTGQGFSSKPLFGEATSGGTSFYSMTNKASRFDDLYLDARNSTALYLRRAHSQTANRPNNVLTEAFGGDVDYVMKIGGVTHTRHGEFIVDWIGFNAIKVMNSLEIHDLYRWVSPFGAKTFASRQPGQWIAACGYNARIRQDLIDAANLSSTAQEKTALLNLANSLPQPIVKASNDADIKSILSGGDMFHIRQIATR